MAELRIPRAHSNDWYDHLATLQAGYYYPWKSTMGSRNGDDSFASLVDESIKDNFVVLDLHNAHQVRLVTAVAARILEMRDAS